MVKALFYDDKTLSVLVESVKSVRTCHHYLTMNNNEGVSPFSLDLLSLSFSSFVSWNLKIEYLLFYKEASLYNSTKELLSTFLRRRYFLHFFCLFYKEASFYMSKKELLYISTKETLNTFLRRRPFIHFYKGDTLYTSTKELLSTFLRRRYYLHFCKEAFLYIRNKQKV